MQRRPETVVIPSQVRVVDLMEADDQLVENELLQATAEAENLWTNEVQIL